MKDMKLATKIALGFGALIIVATILGGTGYYSAMRSDVAIREIGSVRLPSVQSLLTISEAQTAVDSSENALLSREIDLKARQDNYARIAGAWKRAEDAWKIYEPLPQTVEEAATWKRFEPAWTAWKKDHQTFMALSNEYDKTVELQQQGEQRHAKMANQGLNVNPVSFAKAEALLNRIVELYRAKSDNAQATYTRVDLLSVYSLLIISEAQTAIDGVENALLDRNMDVAARQATYDKLAACWKRVETAWKVYEPLEQSPEETKLWEQFVPAWNAWKADHEAFTALSKAYDLTVVAYHQGNELFKKMTQQGLVANAVSFAAAEDLMNKLVQINQDAADEATKTAVGQAGFFKTLSITAMIIGVIVGIILAVFITRSITKPINRIVDVLSSGADQTSSAATQVSAASQSLAQGASEQAAALEETSSSLEEMSSMTKKNAETALQASGLSGEAKNAAEKGNGAMVKMSAAITEIQKSAGETAKIIKVIDEIAFQTNLLALNAAVEAARAGEAGKGFAVVAEEVRNLAMRSAEAAKNTSAMIEESVNSAKNGVAICTEVAKSLEEITGAAGKVNSLVGEISAASQEQSQGIDQVNVAVTQMDKVTQATAANAEESASASEELAAQAEQLQTVIGELIAIVGGAAHSQQTTKTHATVQRHALATVEHTTKSKTASAAKSTAQHKIPLEESDASQKKHDFGDFNKTA